MNPMNSWTGAAPASQLGWMTNMIVSWTLAGGVAGGLLMAILVITSRIHSMGIAAFVVAVGALGCIFGAVHGAVLGYLGRQNGNLQLNRRGWMTLGVSTLAASACAITFAFWLTLSAMTAAVGRDFGVVAFGFSLIISLAIFAWATVNGWHALERAYARWPEKRLGTSLVLGAFAVLSGVMLILRGAIPGTAIQLPLGAAIFLVAIAVFWIVSPAVIVSLRMTSRGYRTTHRDASKQLPGSPEARR